MVRLHSLQSVDEETAAGHVVGLLLGGDGSFDLAAGPEGMMHGSPWVLVVCAEVRSSILSNQEAGSSPGKGDVDQAVVVDSRLDGVGIPSLVQGESQVVGPEGEHALIEEMVVQAIGMPDVGGIAVGRKDLGIELARGVNASAVDTKRKKKISQSDSCTSVDQRRTR